MTSLGRLNRRHVEIGEGRGRAATGTTPLEAVLVASAALALVAFAVWFVFSGSPPLPGLELRSP